MTDIEAQHPRNRLRPAPNLYLHPRRDSFLVTALSLVVVMLATVGKPFMDIPGVVNGSAHVVRRVNTQLFGGFETASVWYGAWTDLIGNIVLFMPLGAAIYVAGRDRARIRWGLGGALLSGLVVSLCVESAQYIFALGFSDIDDLLYNTVGAVLGAVLIARVGHEEQMKILRRLGFLLALAAVVLLAMVAL